MNSSTNPPTDKIATYQFQLLPDLATTEYESLKADIAENGVLVPVEVDQNGDILDGHHRVRAWQELTSAGVALPDYPRLVRRFDDDDTRIEHALKLNLQRRHLTREQLQGIALDLRQRGWSYRRIGDVLAVDPNTVHNWMPTPTVENSTVELPDRVIGKDGKSRPAVMATNKRQEQQAGSFFALDTDEDPVVVDRSTGEILTSLDVRRALERQLREERNSALVAKSNTPISDGTKQYAVIYADPPWRYQFSETETRRIENQYPTMTIEEIAALDIPAAEDAVLFMWATNPKLGEAFAVLDYWGFEYVTNLVWVKDRIGMGYYARSRHELLLVAKRGKLPVPEPANRPDSVIEGKRLEHSAKPLHVYDLIERMYPGYSKIECFARSRREGWDAWGNEAGA